MPKKTLQISLVLHVASVLFYVAARYSVHKKPSEKLTIPTVIVKKPTGAGVFKGDKKVAEMPVVTGKVETPKKTETKPRSIRLRFKDPKQRFVVKSRKGLARPNDRETQAGLLYDLRSGRLLWAKNVDTQLPIASLTKVLTVLTSLNKIERNEKLSRHHTTAISLTAKKVSFSVFLKNYPKKKVPLIELMQAALIKSANDASQQLAETLGGQEGEKAFVAEMNAYAKSLNMNQTLVHNAHGLPAKYAKKTHPDNKSTVRDLMQLSLKAYKYPEIFTWTRKKEIILPKGHPAGVKLNNTNPLVETPGVRGLKTGYTDNAGWCLMFNYEGSEGELVGILLGHPTKKSRNAFARSLLRWGKKVAKKKL